MLDDAHADAGEVADGVEGDERVVAAGLDAQVAAGVVGVEVLVGQRRQRGQRGGPACREAEPAVEERGPVADRGRQPRHRGADGLAGINRRRVQARVLADQFPGCHPRSCRGPLAQQVAQVVLGGAGHGVKGAEREPVLRGVAIPA